MSGATGTCCLHIDASGSVPLAIIYAASASDCTFLGQSAWRAGHKFPSARYPADEQVSQSLVSKPVAASLVRRANDTKPLKYVRFIHFLGQMAQDWFTLIGINMTKRIT